MQKGKYYVLALEKTPNIFYSTIVNNMIKKKAHFQWVTFNTTIDKI